MERFTESVVQQLLAGDDATWRQFHEPLRRIILSAISRYFNDRNELDECIQTALIKVKASGNSYDPSKSFECWVFVVARSVANSKFRQKKVQSERFVPLIEEEDDAIIVAGYVDSHQTDSALLNQDLHAVFTNAREEHKDDKDVAAFFLKKWDEVCDEIIAEILRITVNSVRMKIVRGRLKMLRYMKKYYPEYLEG